MSNGGRAHCVGYGQPFAKRFGIRPILLCHPFVDYHHAFGVCIVARDERAALAECDPDCLEVVLADLADICIEQNSRFRESSLWGEVVGATFTGPFLINQLQESAATPVTLILNWKPQK